jgi:hypothetical protein
MVTAARVNPYYRPLSGVFRQLVVLNGVLFQLSHHLKSRRADVESLLTKHPRRNTLFAGAALIIMDLTEVQPGGYPVLFPIGNHTRRGRRYQTVLDEIATRESAWTVAEGFEAFERFCSEAAAIFLKRNRALQADAAWVGRRRPHSRPASGTLSDVRAFVQASYRGANDIQARLSRSLPGLRKAETLNHRGVNLAHWLVALAAVRHATIHNGQVITPRQIAKCGPEQFKVLREAFPGRRIAAGYRLSLDQKAAADAIEMLAEYAYLICREASLHDGRDPAALKSMRIRV